LKSSAARENAMAGKGKKSKQRKKLIKKAKKEGKKLIKKAKKKAKKLIKKAKKEAKKEAKNSNIKVDRSDVKPPSSFSS